MTRPKHAARERVSFGFGEWLAVFFEELGRHGFDVAAAKRAAIARLDAGVAAQDALDRITGQPMHPPGDDAAIRAAAAVRRQHRDKEGSAP